MVIIEKDIPKTIILSELSDLMPKIEKHYRKNKNLFAGGAFPGLNLKIKNVVFFFDYGDHSHNLANIHNRYSLIFNLSEPMIFLIDDVEFKVPPNHYVLVFPFQKHSYKQQVNPENHKRIHIMFDLNNLADESLTGLKNKIRRITEPEINILKTVTEFVVDEKFLKYQSAIPALLSAFFETSLSALEQECLEKPDPNHAEFIIQKALTYVFNNLNKPLSLKNVADYLKLSESHLRLLFRSQQGRSFGKFIGNIRIYNAIELLGNTNMPISEIAKKCSYSNGFSFSRAFKKATGFAPGIYRKMQVEKIK